ncbi:phenylacetate-CoA oxygenase subunit PaaC [Solwaraspora sp. WMMD406]|uniref:1,2-phenylacetyl-CoA epoxidase subunit PaaC n=1 Tax=Solwaraspora sp. WMMD406 TaxID=3016095 RepID=UPI002415D229|nr:1,2-phenylacetyl-CoA epoxidase subunit PaaC [Solwaraspora sp. WMMD406]MDG4763340.1 phenylacetate-CoA oxygenase subunit PaaC [Solwaraspora sp. WMMD406]
MTTTAPDQLLWWADDALIAAQRLAYWCARAPELEEDVALTNVALDQLGVARLLLTYAAQRLPASAVSAAPASAPLTEDTLAYLRTDHEFRNSLLVELPERDFAVTIGKLLFLSAYQVQLYRALGDSRDERLAAIAAKASKESAYHLDHATLWTVRLGDGTDESHRRMQDAVDELWPYTHELFEPPTDPAGAVDPAALRSAWSAAVEPVLADATLRRPDDDWRPAGGRQGRHTEHLSYLLAEMQVVHRAYPGAQW